MKTKRLTAWLLAAVLVFALVPAMSAPARAADSETGVKAIQLVTNGALSGINSGGNTADVTFYFLDDKGQSTVTAKAGDEIKVCVKIDAGNNLIAGIDAQFNTQGLAIDDFDNISEACGNAILWKNEKELRASFMSVGTDGEPMKVSNGKDAFAFYVTIPSDVKDCTYTMGFGEYLRVYKNGGSSDTYTTSFTPLTIVVGEPVTTYDLWVGGVRVTSTNRGDITAAITAAGGTASGSAEYDPKTNTLTLNGATITGPDSDMVGSSDADGGIVYAGDKEFTVNVTGGASIVTGGNTKRSTSAGLFVGNPDDKFNKFNLEDFNVGITIADGASLTLTGGVPVSTSLYPTSSGLITMTTGKLTVSGAGKLDLNGGASHYSYGLEAFGSILLSGSGSVNATGGDAGSYSCGIEADDVDVDGMTVLSQGGKAEADSVGLHASAGWKLQGDVTVTAGSLEAKAGNAQNSHGIIIGKEMTISGGSVEAEGYTLALSKAPILKEGISAAGSVNIGGKGAVIYNAEDNDTYKWFRAPATFYGVTVTPGTNMLKTTDSGKASQTIIAGSAMTDVIYTADDNYYFPENYSVTSVNGIKVTRNSYTQITVTGTPTADAQITLTAATAKTKENTPNATFTATGPDTGTLSDAATGMTCAIDGGTPTVITGTSVSLTGLKPCTITVIQPGNGTTTVDSDSQTITVTKAGKPSLTAIQPIAAVDTGSIPTDSTHQIRKDGGEWADCTGETSGLVAGTYYIRVKAAGTVLASDAQEIIINKVNIEDAEITLGDALTYNGEEQTQTVKSITLDDIDITAYCDVTDNRGTDAKSYTLTVTAKENSNFTGSVTKEFSIAKADIEKAVITLGDALTYNGEEQMQTVKLVMLNDVDIKDYCDITNDTGKDAGDYELTVTAKADGNYTGSLTAKFAVRPLTGVTVTITGKNNTTVYDGEEHIVSGYDAKADNNLYDAEKNTLFSGTAEAKQTEVGKTSMGLAAEQFENNNTNFTGVTFTVTDGYQEIKEADKTALDQAIDEAQKYVEKIKDTHPEIAEKLKEAVEEAKAVSEKENVTEEKVAAALNKLEKALNAAKALAADKDEFEKVKAEAVSEIWDLLEPNDSAACVSLINHAVRAINELVYDEDLSLDENIDRILKIVSDLEKDLAAQRKRDYDYAMSIAAALRRGRDQQRKLKEEEAARKAAEEAEKKADEETAKKSALPFVDVFESDPFYHDVKYVYDHDLMIGMSDTEFGENLPLTRGMIVTVLHRMEGRPEVTYTGVFTDVPAGEWYTDGVEWAASHGIVHGYGNGKYGPNDNVTREQLAAILFRYANWKGYDTSIGEDTNILSYDDAFDISGWAMSAMQWACGTGVLADVPVGMLRPTDDATRGEIAHAIHVFMVDVKK